MCAEYVESHMEQMCKINGQLAVRKTHYKYYQDNEDLDVEYSTLLAQKWRKLLVHNWTVYEVQCTDNFISQS